MNISKQLKNYRKEFNISQEELSEIIHVSRQTISNWENGKSYPDLQSLLLLSEYFKISLDELVKGDVASMKNELERKELYKLSQGMSISLMLMILTMILVKIWNPYGFVVPFSFGVLGLWFAFKIEKIKKNKDIQTYKEIVAYMEGKEVPRIERNKRKKNVILQSTGFAIGSGAITFVLVYMLFKIFDLII